MKRFTRWLGFGVAALLAVGGLVGCTQAPAEPGKADNMEGHYQLEYQSNGDGTCSVLIRTNDANTPDDLFDIVVPETSPDGDTVTGMLSTLHAYENVPRYMEVEDFDRYIRQPLEAYYGVTEEEAETLLDEHDMENPKYEDGYYLKKALAYYYLKDLDQCQSDRLKQDALAAYPFLEYMDVYILESATSSDEMEELRLKFAEAGITMDHLEAANAHFRSLLGEDYDLVEYDTEWIEIKTFPDGDIQIRHSIRGMSRYVPLDISSTIGIRSITLPDSIRKVEIPLCRQLESVQLPASNAEVSINCGPLTALTVPEGVQILNATGPNISELILPNGIRECSLTGFSKLEKISIPASADGVDLYGTTSLTEIAIDENFRGTITVDVYSDVYPPSLTISGGENVRNIRFNTEKIVFAEGTKAIQMKLPTAIKTIEVPRSVEKINAAIVANIHEKYNDYNDYTDYEEGEEVEEEAPSWVGGVFRELENGIDYNGTIEEWKQIEVFFDYNEFLDGYDEEYLAQFTNSPPDINIQWTVHCTDGDYVATYQFKAPSITE